MSTSFEQLVQQEFERLHNPGEPEELSRGASLLSALTQLDPTTAAARLRELSADQLRSIVLSSVHDEAFHDRNKQYPDQDGMVSGSQWAMSMIDSYGPDSALASS